MKNTRKALLSLLLSAVLTLFVFSAALPAFAAPNVREEESFGLAKGYVRLNETYKSSDGTLTTVVRSVNKQGKITKETETNKSSEGAVDKHIKSYVYDKKGFLIKETDKDFYDDGNSDVSVALYTNNKKGKPTRIEYRMGESSHVIEITYDKKGNMTKEVNYFNNGIDTTTYTYNKKGNVTKEQSKTEYEDNTWNKFTLTYTYDKQGNTTKESYVQSASDGSAETQTTTRVYNAKGQLIKCTESFLFNNHVGYESTSQCVTTYAYGKNGKVSKEVERRVYDNGPEEKTTTAYTYDSKGRVTKTAVSYLVGGGASKSTTTYSYDKKGNLIKEANVYKDMDGIGKTTDTFSYDKAGNLIKQVDTYS